MKNIIIIIMFSSKQKPYWNLVSGLTKLCTVWNLRETSDDLRIPFFWNNDATSTVNRIPRGPFDFCRRRRHIQWKHRNPISKLRSGMRHKTESSAIPLWNIRYRWLLIQITDKKPRLLSIRWRELKKNRRSARRIW